MNILKRFIRLLHIYFVLLKHGLDKYIWGYSMFRPIHFMIIFFPWRWFGKKTLPEGQDIRLALEELGPIFVKFGQVLSIRRDILPDSAAKELAKLQDKVPPFPGELAKKMIESSLQQSLEYLFAEFSLQPIASASIAQVHSARLHDGNKVVVKVLRPNIHYLIARDVALLELMAKLLFRYVPHLRRFRPIEVVEEFKCTLFDELDLLREAANASQLRRNFAHSDALYIPKVYWQYTRTNVLVLEHIYGINVCDVESLIRENFNLQRLAERGVEMFFTQVFRDCFFHADMHPGNLFVCKSNRENPRYIAVDFGIMGTLSPEDQRYLGENFLAFFQRDYRRVAELHVQSGWVPPHTRVEAFESAIRTVCEPIFERPLKEISIGQSLVRLFQTARRFDMEVQPQLILLQKTLLTVEGLGRQLYPDLDLWKTAKPFLENWMKRQFGIKALYRTIKDKYPIWLDRLPELPEAIHDVAQYWQNETHYLKHSQHAKRMAHKELLIPQTKRWVRKLSGVALLLFAAVLATHGTPLVTLWQIIEQHHAVVMTGSILLGLYLLLKS